MARSFLWTVFLWAACGERSEPVPGPTATPSPGGCGTCSVRTDAELAAHHRKVVGEPLDRNCVRRIERGPFAGAIVVGDFAHDRGCDAQGVHFRCCYHDEMQASAGPLLAAAGWDAAATTRRGELALAWIEQVAHAFGARFLHGPTPHFAAAKKTFAAPAATATDAGVTVRGWVEERAGMVQESRYSLLEVRFSPSGQHAGGAQVETFTVRPGAADAAPPPPTSKVADCGTCRIATDAALAEHHRKVAGESLDARCVRRVAEGPFAGAIVVGGFAHDRGCRASGVHMRCCFHAPETAAAAPLLAAAGWASADDTRRGELAIAFADHILHAFQDRFLRETNPHFAKAQKRFAPPTVKSSGAGVAVRGWLREPPGMVHQTSYELVEYRFSPTGAHAGTDRVDAFAIPGG